MENSNTAEPLPELSVCLTDTSVPLCPSPQPVFHGQGGGLQLDSTASSDWHLGKDGVWLRREYYKYSGQSQVSSTSTISSVSTSSTSSCEEVRDIGTNTPTRLGSQELLATVRQLDDAQLWVLVRYILGHTEELSAAELQWAQRLQLHLQHWSDETFLVWSELLSAVLVLVSFQLRTSDRRVHNLNADLAARIALETQLRQELRCLRQQLHELANAHSDPNKIRTLISVDTDARIRESEQLVVDLRRALQDTGARCVELQRQVEELRTGQKTAEKHANSLSEELLELGAVDTNQSASGVARVKRRQAQMQPECLEVDAELLRQHGLENLEARQVYKADKLQTILHQQSEQIFRLETDYMTTLEELTQAREAVSQLRATNQADIEKLRLTEQQREEAVSVSRRLLGELEHMQGQDETLRRAWLELEAARQNSGTGDSTTQAQTGSEIEIRETPHVQLVVEYLKLQTLTKETVTANLNQQIEEMCSRVAKAEAECAAALARVEAAESTVHHLQQAAQAQAHYNATCGKKEAEERTKSRHGELQEKTTAKLRSLEAELNAVIVRKDEELKILSGKLGFLEIGKRPVETHPSAEKTAAIPDLTETSQTLAQEHEEPGFCRGDVSTAEQETNRSGEVKEDEKILPLQTRLACSEAGYNHLEISKEKRSFLSVSRENALSARVEELYLQLLKKTEELKRSEEARRLAETEATRVMHELQLSEAKENQEEAERESRPRPQLTDDRPRDKAGCRVSELEVELRLAVRDDGRPCEHNQRPERSSSRNECKELQAVKNATQEIGEEQDSATEPLTNHCQLAAAKAPAGLVSALGRAAVETTRHKLRRLEIEVEAANEKVTSIQLAHDRAAGELKRITAERDVLLARIGVLEAALPLSPRGSGASPSSAASSADTVSPEISPVFRLLPPDSVQQRPHTSDIVKKLEAELASKMAECDQLRVAQHHSQWEFEQRLRERENKLRLQLMGASNEQNLIPVPATPSPLHHAPEAEGEIRRLKAEIEQLQQELVEYQSHTEVEQLEQLRHEISELRRQKQEAETRIWEYENVTQAGDREECTKLANRVAQLEAELATPHKVVSVECEAVDWEVEACSLRKALDERTKSLESARMRILELEYLGVQAEAQRGSPLPVSPLPIVNAHRVRRTQWEDDETDRGRRRSAEFAQSLERTRATAERDERIVALSAELALRLAELERVTQERDKFRVQCIRCRTEHSEKSNLRPLELRDGMLVRWQEEHNFIVCESDKAIQDERRRYEETIADFSAENSYLKKQYAELRVAARRAEMLQEAVTQLRRELDAKNQLLRWRAISKTERASEYDRLPVPSVFSSDSARSEWRQEESLYIKSKHSARYTTCQTEVAWPLANRVSLQPRPVVQDTHYGLRAHADEARLAVSATPGIESGVDLCRRLSFSVSPVRTTLT
eukprot:TRINITY_DN28717_c0_g1_i1.p1 TRINITY_DN28717_c0_g1~~TRINITY_DN28717_c0_g1_i1.p1  ORF type:complete len:1449 (+),score=289.29 TRINITY_DN28717_c0_g1_i1:58-4347(+)